MAFHIVTNRCFLACEKVTSVIIEETISESKIRRRKKVSKKKSTKLSLKNSLVTPPPSSYFTISIGYYPLSQKVSNNHNNNVFNNSSSNDESLIEIKIYNKKEAFALYAEIIKEVQEQHPGEGYLDKLVTRILLGEDFKEEE